MVLEGYPPDPHILRDLGIEVGSPSERTGRARLRVTPFVLGSDGGVRAGVLATVVDIVGGALAARVLRPDWMATSDLALHIVRPITGPIVEVRGSVLRRGRTTLVIEVDVVELTELGIARERDDRDRGRSDGGSGDQSDQAAWATMTFAVLPQTSGTPHLSGTPDLLGTEANDSAPTVRPRVVPGSGRLDRPIAEVVKIAMEDAAAGRVSMPVDGFVRNSFGAVQGGMMALIGDVAGTAAIAASPGGCGTPVAAMDLQVAYLNLGRVGPITSRARVSATGPTGGCATVELADDGALGRLTTVISVRALVS